MSHTRHLNHPVYHAGGGCLRLTCALVAQVSEHASPEGAQANGRPNASEVACAVAPLGLVRSQRDQKPQAEAWGYSPMSLRDSVANAKGQPRRGGSPS